MAQVVLSNRQWTELQDFILHAPSAKELRRAQAVLWLAEGESVEQIAELLHVSRQTVYNWVDRFEERQALDLRSRLADSPREGRPPTASGIIDPLIAEVIDTDPRELGYHSTVWTAPLLREYLEQVHGVAVSRKSVSVAIARLNFRWKRPRYVLSRRPEHWRQSKGG